MKVIVFSAKACGGKDTTANFVKEHLKNCNKKVLIIHYADLLKFICKAYFEWDGQKDAFGRSLLQEVGTDIIRAQEPDFWVDQVIKVLKFFPDRWDYVLVPDCRFPNEIDKMSKDFETIHVRIIRPNFDNGLSDEQKQHPSETSLDHVAPDWLIENDGTLEDLSMRAKEFVSYLLDDNI